MLSRAGEEADVARLGREVRRRAEEADVARLDRRVRQLQGQLSSIQEAAADTEGSVDDLSGRVSDLTEELEGSAGEGAPEWRTRRRRPVGVREVSTVSSWEYAGAQQQSSRSGSVPVFQSL